MPEPGRQVPIERGEAGGVRGRAGQANPRCGGGPTQGALLLSHLRPGRPGGCHLRLPRHQRQCPWRQPRRRRHPYPPRQLLRPQRAHWLHLRLATGRPRAASMHASRRSISIYMPFASIDTPSIC
ncbi:14 kDa proline-rich protein DC2.15 [Dichanthelium oligosanthes]|uniref:14 kDa proline-rich protein DC2.15 n=1 Tax=Dichanthelium oligosanthes TaxID=888268 RepID=A0A1E5URR0_9POAL|nr:14 kDa proline-rich protein DC2.15 [Dichanthelium oligosanthes]